MIAMMSTADPLQRHRPTVAMDIARLKIIEQQITATPERTGSLAQEWTTVCNDIDPVARCLLLPTAIETFNTAPSRALKAAAGAQVVDLAFYFTGATYDETIAGIEQHLCAVSDFANETKNRRLVGLASEKLAELARQVKSLNHP